MTDGKSYDYNGQAIPPSALKTILKRPLLASLGTEADVDSGRLSGLIFVSERTHGPETLHIALFFQDQTPKVFEFAEVYDTFNGVRLEDSGYFAADYLIYVSTMEPAPEFHQPWTAVYKTNLKTGETKRLTPQGQADLSPTTSPDGKRIAVASFEEKGGWDGEVEDLKTSIYVMDVEEPLNRELVVSDGGWPAWGSDNVLFSTITLRRFTFQNENEREEDQYRHIEIFDINKPNDQSVAITLKVRPKADHFNPFVLDGGKRIGYHRCHTDKANAYNVVEKDFYELQSSYPEIGVFRMSGVFPAISDCGTKLAFVDNEFKAVWVADSSGLYMVYKRNDSNSIFSTAWNRKRDILYVCVGPSFTVSNTVQILAITNATGKRRQFIYQTQEGYNCAFPCTNRDSNPLLNLYLLSLEFLMQMKFNTFLINTISVFI